MKHDKLIAKTAKKLAELEKKRYEVDDVASIDAQIEKICQELNPDEMTEIDDYIIENNLLTK